MARTMPRTATRGFTLVEIGVVLGMTAVLATLAMPSWLDQLARSRRVEATAALQQVQRAQERYRETHGRYAGRLDELPGAPGNDNPDSHYRVELHSLGPDGYRARAIALAGQVRDRACTELGLRVQGFISQREPERGCWSL
jgi:type IV pilus assembly protein PilE